MGAVIREGELDFHQDNVALRARVGTFGEQKQPVVYLSIGNDRTLVLGYDTLNNVIDLLCGKKEALREKLLGRVEVPNGKTYRASVGRSS